MNHSEILSALQVHATREHIQAERALAEAEAAAGEAEDRVHRTVGSGVEDWHRRIRAEAADLRSRKVAQAQRHVERAATARSGMLLMRADVEGRDYGWACENQSLFVEAQRHGLVTDRPVK